MEAAHLPEPVFDGPAIEQMDLAESAEVIDLPLAAPTHLSFAEFESDLRQPEWATMSPDGLLEVRKLISAYFGAMLELLNSTPPQSPDYVAIIEDHDAAYRKLVEINGWLRDRFYTADLNPHRPESDETLSYN